MVDISIQTAGLVAVLGYATVFLGLAILMCVIYILGSVMKNSAKKAEQERTDLGSITVPAGSDYKKIAAITAAIAASQSQRS